MKAKFRTEKVEYVIENGGYSRNGHFVQGEVKLKSLSIGSEAQIEIKTGAYTQLIRTDIVHSIDLCPAIFKMQMATEVHPYRIKVVNKNSKPGIFMKIGTEKEIQAYVKDRFKVKRLTYAIEPIPTRLELVQ